MFHKRFSSLLPRFAERRAARSPSVRSQLSVPNSPQNIDGTYVRARLGRPPLMSRFRELHTSSANLSSSSGLTRTHSGKLVPVVLGLASPVERKLRPIRRKYAPLLPPRSSRMTTDPQRDLRRKHATTSEDYCKPGTGPGRFGSTGYEGYPWRRDAVPGVDLQATSYSVQYPRWPEHIYAMRGPNFRPEHDRRPHTVDPSIFRSTSQTSFQPPPEHTPAYNTPRGALSPAASKQLEAERQVILQRLATRYPADMMTTSGAVHQRLPRASAERTRSCRPPDSPHSVIGDYGIEQDFQTSSSSAFIRHSQSGPLWRADKSLSTMSCGVFPEA